MLPNWVQIVIGIAAVIGACGVIYTKMLRPFVESVELMNDIRRDIGAQPDVFAILNEIAKQFRTNAGSSLKDSIIRVEEALASVRVTTDANLAAIEAGKVLAEQDRRTAARLEELLNRVTAKADIAAKHAAGVAFDLEQAHVRAEAVVGAAVVPGEAADAAMQRSANPEPRDPESK